MATKPLALDPNPPHYTQIEKRMYRALDALNVRYFPQRPFGFYRVDAWLPGYAIALEADGCFTHGCKADGWEDISVFHENKRRHRDHVLLTRHHVLALHLWGHDLQSNTQAIESVRRILSPYVPALQERDVS